MSSSSLDRSTLMSLSSSSLSARSPCRFRTWEISDVLISAANSMSWILLAGWFRSLRFGTLSFVGDPVARLSNLDGLTERCALC